jgi:predicted deacetylase
VPPDPQGRLAVALHDIEPATFEHCSLIREWLTDLGVERVTLCVIPAADHHPFFQRSPAMTAWLRERRAEGDAIAQQGFVGGRAPSARESVEHVRAGRRLLQLADLEPSGYRAPSLGHVVSAWRELSRTFDWWLAAGRMRTGSVRGGGTLRVDVHPHDFDHPTRARALERTLKRAAERCRSVTYDDLAAASGGATPAIPGDLPRVLRAP